MFCFAGFDTHGRDEQRGHVCDVGDVLYLNVSGEKERVLQPPPRRHCFILFFSLIVFPVLDPRCSSSSAEDADPMQEEDQSDMADDEEDAFSDDSAVAMQDDLLLLRSEDAGDSFPALAAAEQRSGDGDGGGAADGASGVESRGSIENGLVSGGRPSGLGEEVQSEKAGDEDEEEYSDPGEESLRDDEATLSEASSHLHRLRTFVSTRRMCCSFCLCNVMVCGLLCCVGT